MALIVVGASPVLRDVVRVYWRTEKILAHIVHGRRERVADAVGTPGRRPLHERRMQAVIVRVRERRVLVVVRVRRVRAAAIVGSARNARGHVLVDRDDEPQAAEILVAETDGPARADLLL